MLLPGLAERGSPEKGWVSPGLGLSADNLTRARFASICYLGQSAGSHQPLSLAASVIAAVLLEQTCHDNSTEKYGCKPHTQLVQDHGCMVVQVPRTADARQFQNQRRS